MSGGPEGWSISLGGSDKGRPLSPNAPPSITPEPVSTGGAASSMRPLPSRKKPGVDAGGQGSLDCLSSSRQPRSIRYSPIDGTDISYIEGTVSV